MFKNRKNNPKSIKSVRLSGAKVEVLFHFAVEYLQFQNNKNL